jgi:hypothetical protein
MGASAASYPEFDFRAPGEFLGHVWWARQGRRGPALLSVLRRIECTYGPRSRRWTRLQPRLPLSARRPCPVWTSGRPVRLARVWEIFEAEGGAVLHRAGRSRFGRPRGPSSPTSRASATKRRSPNSGEPGMPVVRTSMDPIIPQCASGIDHRTPTARVLLRSIERLRARGWNGRNSLLPPPCPDRRTGWRARTANLDGTTFL